MNEEITRKLLAITRSNIIHFFAKQKLNWVAYLLYNCEKFLDIELKQNCAAAVLISLQKIYFFSICVKNTRHRQVNPNSVFN